MQQKRKLGKQRARRKRISLLRFQHWTLEVDVEVLSWEIYTTELLRLPNRAMGVVGRWRLNASGYIAGTEPQALLRIEPREYPRAFA